MYNKRRNIFITTITSSIVLIGLSLMIPTVSSSLFSETYNVNTIIDEQTTVFFIGNISFSGSFYGIPLNYSLDSFSDYIPFLEGIEIYSDLHEFTTINDLFGYPVFAESIIHQATAYIIDTTLLSDIEQYIIDHGVENLGSFINKYSNSTIKIKNGITLFGSEKKQYQVFHEQSYGIGGFLQFPISTEFPTKGFGILTDEETVIHSPTSSSILYPIDSIIEIIVDGEIIHTVKNSDTIILLRTTNKTIIQQQSAFHYFPINADDTESTECTISLLEEQKGKTDLISLINQLNNTTILGNEQSIHDIIPFNQKLDFIIPLISNVFNSGIILFNTSQQLSIEDTSYDSLSLIAARGSSFTLTMNEESNQDISLTGNARLLFINDHLYTSQTKKTNDGITLPFYSIILWIVAFTMILFYWFTKKQNRLPQKKNNNLSILQKRWVKFGLQIGVFILCFLLVDQAFSFRFGLSFFAIMNLKIELLIVALFFVIQLLILVIFFILYALPVRLIHDLICKTMINNQFQPITRMTMILLFFWIGIQIYLLVLFNIILSFIPLPSFPGIG